MFNTKKDVDQHVRSALSKLKSEHEKKIRGFPIAKLYYKINEFETARHYISMFLLAKEECAPAHKLLGLCYQEMKKPQKALESFQRSLQLEPKQPDLLIEVCKLFLNNNDNNSININKAKYWCDLAEQEKIQHDVITDLRSKLLNSSNMDTKQIEELLLKEIAARPNDPNLKVRIVKHYIEQNKIQSAYNYVYEQELKYHDLFVNSSGWYNIVWLTLNKYKNQSNINKKWDYWLLVMICLERQVEISLVVKDGSLTETANILFNLDQCMFEASQCVNTLFPEIEFAEKFINHFRGQLCLYAASFIFKREQIQNKNQWKESIKNSLPLLLFAFQCGTSNVQEPWLKHCSDKTKQLIQLWNHEGAFRCSQAGRTVLACIHDNSKDNTSVSLQVHQIITEKVYWTNSNDFLSYIRRFCLDTSWRTKIYRILFANSDQISKMSTSYFVNSQDLTEPNYELPSYADIESYEEIAQYLRPQSLQHMVYLCLGIENLSDVRCKYFNGLNFSVQNLNFCGSESLNQLDIETFLYASTIQVKRLLEIEKQHLENYNSINIGKPMILPFVNMIDNLCTEDQRNWWLCVYQVYKNLVNGENLSEIRATLQYGIEAVRGVNGPKMDLIIILNLGKIFMNRCQDATKPIEKNFLENRTEALYKHALNVYKLHIKGVLEPFRKLFKYNNSNNSNIENEIIELAEEAVTYLAANYFKHSQYEECIEEFSGIQLPFATYFQAEAYKKLDESNKTTKKTKHVYLEKAKDCLNQTVNLLNFPNINSNHPLNSVIHSEIKRLQSIRQLSNENTNNGHYSTASTTSTTVDNNREFYFGTDEHPSFYSCGGGSANRSRRESSSAPKLWELENLVKQIATTLTFVKEELSMIKPEVKDTCKELVEFKSGIKTELNEFKSGVKTELNEFTNGIKTDLGELREKLLLIEEIMKKKSQTPSRDDGSNVLDELYLIGDDLQNQVYSNQNNVYTGYVQPHLQQQQQQQRIHTPNALSTSHHPVLPAPLPSSHHPQPTPWFSPEFFTQPQYMHNPANAYSSSMAERQHLSFNQRFAFPDTTTNATMNFHLPPPLPSVPIAPPQQTTVTSQTGDNRSLFSFMSNQQTTNVQQQSTNKPSPVQPSATTTSSAVKSSPAFWNRVYNNAPVEKGPPVNVVITSSDPLPTTNVGVFPQPTLSVTIPPQHIKPSLIPNDNQIGVSSCPIQQTNSNTSFPIINQSFSIIPTSSTAVSLSSVSLSSNEIEAVSTSIPKYSEKQRELDVSTENDNDNTDLLEKSCDSNAEYDPRPDFKAIIPLPDEVEVKTGEENEDVLFCSRAKLFRHVDKEWKERGTGDIKILKSKNDGKFRILMRRDQTHKICANHFITGEMDLIQRKNEEKSYIWAAKDYADEEERSETLCVRFKLAETAKEFHDVFIKVRDEIKNKINDQGQGTIITASSTNFSNKLSTIFNFNVNADSHKNTVTENPIASSINYSKSIFTIPSGNQITDKTGIDEKNNTTNKIGDNSIKSPFTGFTFDTKTTISNAIKATLDTNNSFGNLFSNLTTKSQSFNDKNFVSEISNVLPGITASLQMGSISSCITVNNPNDITTTSAVQLNKSNTNDEDDFIPTAEFKPVIPLPDLVEIQTGEENEIILFEHRAKLFRYDKILSQWKERGVGNIKLLVEKNNKNHVRLLMRREQVLKVCINLRLTKSTQFKPVRNNLQFGGKDYSDENDGKLESFTIRFKTLETCKSFQEAILKAQMDMTEDDNDEIDDKENVSSESDQLLNISDKNSEIITKENKTESKTVEKQQNNFSDQFKPKPGSWMCNVCYISNESDTLYCVACEAPKDDTVPKKKPINIFDISSKTSTTSTPFKFGFGSTPISSANSITGDNKTTVISSSITTTTTTTQSANATTAVNSNPISVGFGDKFKPTPGSWACKLCYVTNKEDVQYCLACNSPKDDTIPKKDVSLQQTNNIFCTTKNSSGFTFGFQNASTKLFESNTTADAVDLTKHQQQQQPFKFDNFINNKTATPAIFGVNTNTNSTVMNSESISKPSTFSFNIPSTTAKSLSTLENDNEFKLEKKEFNFVLKPKSPGKVKSPLKNNISGGIDEESDNEDVEEENNAYFTPVIPLPDKIEVKTGEEEEDVLYCHRAKLYRFANSEWKERGLGEVKILRHKITKKLRVVMRREQVLKICLNHVLTHDIEYMAKDDKSWHFVVKDFSEGELELQQFCIRFKTKEIASEFMKAIKNALNEDIDANKIEKEQHSNVIPARNDDNISNEVSNEGLKTNQQLAEKLQLPLDFYEKVNSCEGCRGCDPDKFIFPTYDNENQKTENDETTKPLPLDMSALGFSKKSPSNVKNPILRQSALAPIQTKSLSEHNNSGGDEKASIFNNTTTGNKSTNVFNLGDNINLFGSSFFNATGQKSIFGGTLFNSTTAEKTSSETSISNDAKNIPQESKQNFIFGNTANTGFNFDSKNYSYDSGVKNKDENVGKTEISNSVTGFKDPGISFSDLAKISKDKNREINKQETPTGGFFGLTQNDAFKNFMNPPLLKTEKTNDDTTPNANKNQSNGEENANSSNYDSNYDPHYEPIIALPNEIKVVTGEENETKLFGERATLYRYDSATKQWKERGVGELKILYHPEQGTYRLILRREQIHKLVLNHAITDDFSMKPMNNSGKAYCWAAQNFAEDEPSLEKLACRFKQVETGQRFESEINKCIKQLKKREPDLEPEED